MRSGVNIDCKYVVRMKKVMEIEELPYPRRRLTRPDKKLFDCDGSILPLITVSCEERIQ